jgi:hypothetical protein
VQNGWHRVSTGTAELTAELRAEVCRLTISTDDEFRLVRSEESGVAGPFVTQCVALFPVWGIRGRYHERYLTHVGSVHGGNPVVVPQRDSWVDNRPLTLRDYEHDMAQRLLKEVLPILRCFLPAYSIASLSEAPVPGRVYAYMAMTAPGRILFAGTSISTLQPLLQGLGSRPAALAIGSDALAKAMRTRYRDFLPFETQLFALERLRLRGETALALIGSLSLLEWLLNGRLQDLGLREANLAGALRRPEINFFTTEEEEFLHRARRARNDIVHGAPPPRQSLTAGGAEAGRETGGMTSTLSAEDVRNLIELVFKAFRQINVRRSARSTK